MTRSAFNSLMDFDPHQNTIGYDRMFDRVNRMLQDINGQVNQKYPPYNIIRHEDNVSIELAVAGFAQDDINITVTDGILTIEGSKTEKLGNDKYIHKGIGTRSFTRKFSLSDNTEIVGASMENGMLVIGLKEVVPEHKKPRQIAITNGNTVKSEKEFLTEKSEV